LNGTGFPTSRWGFPASLATGFPGYEVGGQRGIHAIAL
jgi:hypothetical protein